MGTNKVAEARGRFRGFESVPVPVTVRAGRTRVTLARLTELAPGDVLVLDRAVGSPFDLLAGDVLLGRVEPVVSGDRVAFKLVCAVERDDGAAG